MYYINFIFLYSILGFILESVVYKYYNVNNHSSIFIGPYTLVYGFGMLFCYLIYLHLKLPNHIINYLIYYLIFVITTSLIEFVGGHIIHFLLGIDKWNYSYNKYSIGKYVTLKNSLIWGILVSINLYIFHPYFQKYILNTIPYYVTIIGLIIFTIDLILLIKKIMKHFS